MATLFDIADTPRDYCHPEAIALRKHIPIADLPSARRAIYSPQYMTPEQRWAFDDALGFDIIPGHDESAMIADAWLDLVYTR
jgi:hypothetical protein